jgi:hypothetical protein
MRLPTQSDPHNVDVDEWLAAVDESAGLLADKPDWPEWPEWLAWMRTGVDDRLRDLGLDDYWPASGTIGRRSSR